jgi:hypothetical protein
MRLDFLAGEIVVSLSVGEFHREVEKANGERLRLD